MTQAADTMTVLGLLSAILVVLIWIAWRSWRSMSKEATNPMKKTLGFLGVMVLVVLFWIGWKFQPWMPTGRAIHLSSEHFGDYDFQVWQRKNAGIGEPFATALFVRKQGGQWNAFLLDFEDTYRPTIRLRKEDSRISVLYGSTRWGHFDEARQVFKRDSNGASFSIEGVVIDSDPPGNWWVKQSLMP